MAALCRTCRSVQLPGPDSVCSGGEAPSSVRPHRQLRRGELRLPGVQRALRPLLLALLPHLPRPRAQRAADPTGWLPVSLPGVQTDGAERRRRRPHVLRTPTPRVDKRDINELSRHFERALLCHDFLSED